MMSMFLTVNMIFFWALPLFIAANFVSRDGVEF
jgi:hypothetical protein